MSKKQKTCLGCGVVLQDENMLQEGYTTDINNTLCQRCFRMKNYGEYQVVTKSNDEYIEILKDVNKTGDLVLFIVSLCNLDQNLNYIRTYLSNPMILVLNKRDALPKSVKDEKIIAYLKEQGVDVQDLIIISCKNNYHIDELYHRIQQLKKSKNVYVVGHTNVGKSSMINKFIHNYSDQDHELTISPLPSTTLNKVVIKLNEKITLIDTPGLLNHGDLSNYVSSEELKRIHPKKEIKPKTFQIKPGQCLIVDNFARIDYVEGEKNSFTFYMSNQLKIKKMNANKQNCMKELFKTSIDIKYGEDLVINGLGWVKIVSKCKVDLYLDKNISSFTRKSII